MYSTIYIFFNLSYVLSSFALPPVNAVPFLASNSRYSNPQDRTPPSNHSSSALGEIPGLLAVCNYKVSNYESIPINGIIARDCYTFVDFMLQSTGGHTVRVPVGLVELRHGRCWVGVTNTGTPLATGTHEISDFYIGLVAKGILDHCLTAQSRRAAPPPMFNGMGILQDMHLMVAVGGLPDRLPPISNEPRLAS